MAQPMEPEQADGDFDKTPTYEGFCPACSQPRVKGVILHQSYCPLSKFPHYNEDELG